MSYTGKTLSHGGRELIAFRIGDQEFTVNVMSVREIRGWTPATPDAAFTAYVMRRRSICAAPSCRSSIMLAPASA